MLPAFVYVPLPNLPRLESPSSNNTVVKLVNRILHETIEYINNLNEKDLIFFSDFNKAFDSLDHNFMKKCWRKFKFPNYIINWVDLFYKDAKSSIHNNGHLSSFFSIEKGVRQGCPLLPYLFIICIELLSNEISLK